MAASSRRAGSGSEASHPACKSLTRASAILSEPRHSRIAGKLGRAEFSSVAVRRAPGRRRVRRVAASANFDDFYQIDPDLSITKC
jgi:hypothetical protein